MATPSENQISIQSNKSSDDHDNDGSFPDGSRLHSKRRKLSLACDPCRVRKIRCDGQRPHCGPCQARKYDSQPCIYQERKETSLSERYDTQLLRRIRDLEVRLDRRLDSPGSRNTPSSQVQVRSPYILSGMPSERQTSRNQSGTSLPSSIRTPPAPLSHIPPAESESHSTTRPTPSVDNGPDSVNAMGANSFTDAPAPPNAFYGGSSAAHFMNQVHKEMPVKSRRKQLHDEASVPPSQTVNFNNTQPQQPTEDFTLPTRHLADQLFQVYWEKSHNLYPFLHRPSMEQAYANMWKSPNRDSYQRHGSVDLGLGSHFLSNETTSAFHCALNAIFALGCQLAPLDLHLQDRHGLSERFFLRSRELLHIDVLDHGSLSIVQTLLIIAQYLQSTQSPSRCWNSLGLACRIGQGLGLHIEDVSSGRDPREVEVRRRIWHGCNMMDIVTSMTLGRPMMTHQHNLPLPSALYDKDYVAYEDSGRLVKLSYLDFYVEAIKLYQILGCVVTNVYNPWSPYTNHEISPGPSPSSQDKIQNIISLAELLSNYEDQICLLLHWDRGQNLRDGLPEAPRAIFQRQSDVLCMRYLHVQILLHRPSFFRVCRKLASPSESSPGTTGDDSIPHEWSVSKSKLQPNFRSNLELKSAVQCIIASIDIISVVHESTSNKAAGAWWYTLFYLYSAGMILILAKSCQPIREHFDKSNVDQAWLQCCETLQQLLQYNNSAEICMKSLVAMHDRLVLNSEEQLASLKEQSSKATPTSGSQAINVTSNDSSSNGGQELHPVPTNLPGSDFWTWQQPFMDFITNDMDTTLSGMYDIVL